MRHLYYYYIYIKESKQGSKNWVATFKDFFSFFLSAEGWTRRRRVGSRDWYKTSEMDETIEHREKEKKRGKIEIRHLQQGNRSS
jgi:cytidylate kinase